MACTEGEEERRVYKARRVDLHDPWKLVAYASSWIPGAVDELGLRMQSDACGEHVSFFEAEDQQHLHGEDPEEVRAVLRSTWTLPHRCVSVLFGPDPVSHHAEGCGIVRTLWKTDVGGPTTVAMLVDVASFAEREVMAACNPLVAVNLGPHVDVCTVVRCRRDVVATFSSVSS